MRSLRCPLEPELVRLDSTLAVVHCQRPPDFQMHRVIPSSHACPISKKVETNEGTEVKVVTSVVLIVRQIPAVRLSASESIIFMASRTNSPRSVFAMTSNRTSDTS